jgi:hypothetical protein
VGSNVLSAELSLVGAAAVSAALDAEAEDDVQQQAIGCFLVWKT